jgi:hypothetical protein
MFGKILEIVGYENEIIYVYSKNDENCIRFFLIHICIKKTFKKRLVEKVVVKNFILNMGGLLQSIKGLSKLLSHFQR